MDNSVNNNLNNSVTDNIATNVSSGVVQPTPVAATTIQPVQTVSNVQPTQVATSNMIPVTSAQPTGTNGNNINKSKNNDTNTFLIVGLFVGFVLLAAIFLLVLLVTGVIGNRNRLTCTRTINEEGFTHHTERLYILEKGVYTKVENTDIYTYTSLTDDLFNEKFGPIIEIKSGVSQYGFGTQVNRDGNIVTITSYNPNFFNYSLDKVKTDNANEGFTCK